MRMFEVKFRYRERHDCTLADIYEAFVTQILPDADVSLEPETLEITQVEER